MAYCNECGIQLQDGVRFCHACGAPAPGADPASTPGPGQSDTGKSGPAGSSEPDFRTELRSGPVYGADLENLPPGYVVDDRYEIKEKVGQGGFGAVYRVHDRKMDIDKALKVLPKLVAEDKESMERLLAEARTMVRLNHPHIVRLYEIYYSGPIKYLDMEFVSGGSLSDRKLAAANKRLPEKAVRAIALQVAAGLAYAHRNGVIHKDIKPQNILLAADTVAPERIGPDTGSDAGPGHKPGAGVETGNTAGKTAGSAAGSGTGSGTGSGAAPGSTFEAKVMDFGISETVRTSLSRLSNTSSSGTLVYMSPEQIRGKDVGREADIYSFGAMLYELLSGHPPFYKGAIEHQILSEPPEPIEGISDFMNDFLLKCLEKDYKDRFRTFEQVMTALKAGRLKPSPASSSSKTPVPDKSPASATDRSGDSPPAKKSGAGKIFLVFIILAVLAALGIGYVEHQKEQERVRARAEERYRLGTKGRPTIPKTNLRFIDEKDTVKTPAKAVPPPASTKQAISGAPFRSTIPKTNLRFIDEGDDDAGSVSQKIGQQTEAERARTERAAAAKAAAPAAPASPDRRKAANNLGMEFVWIEPGTYMRGSPSGESGRFDDERQHRVTLTKGFYMQTTEVTQGQWKAVMGNNPSRFSNCGDNCPVENVSWDDVQEFIRKLNSRTGGNYRLPTEAEWEYAARAGTSTRFYFGNSDSGLGDYAWFSGNAGGKTHPVARKKPNAWGLYDMHGNVWEWCSDWCGDYPAGSVTDPTGPSSGTNRVIRGGGWSSDARRCRSAIRDWYAPFIRDGGLGFRLAAPQVR